MVRNPLNRPHRIEIHEEEGTFKWVRKSGNSQPISTSVVAYKVKKNLWTGLKLANADWEQVKIVDYTVPHRKEVVSPSS